MYMYQLLLQVMYIYVSVQQQLYTLHCQKLCNIVLYYITHAATSTTRIGQKGFAYNKKTR